MFPAYRVQLAVVPCPRAEATVSIQLTLARAEARAAEEAWRDHLDGCPPCSRWRRRLKGQQPCRTGRETYDHHKACDETLKRERDLEKKPWPGQEALFPEVAAAPVTSPRDAPGRGEQRAAWKAGIAKHNAAQRNGRAGPRQQQAAGYRINPK